MKPEVSVVIPAFNAQKYITATIESMLSQTFKDIEVVVVDDASTDSTFSIISGIAKKDKRVKVYRNERNLGTIRTLNRAIELSAGRYIARMDADDLSHPSRIEKQHAVLKAHPDVGIVGCGLLIINEVRSERSTIVRPGDDESLRLEMAKYTPIGANAMIRRSVLDEVGLFDAEIGAEEELEIMIRIAGKAKLACVPDILYTYFIRSTGRSISSRKLKKKIVMIRLNMRAIRELELPVRLYAYPLGWLIYAFCPVFLKSLIRKAVSRQNEQITGMA